MPHNNMNRDKIKIVDGVFSALVAFLECRSGRDGSMHTYLIERIEILRSYYRVSVRIGFTVNVKDHVRTINNIVGT